MSSDRDTTRIVRSWLDEGVTQLPDRVLDAVLDQVPATPQRRATWWPVRRYQSMNSMLKFGLAAAVVAVIAIVGYQLLPGSTVDVGGPMGTPVPSVTPQSSPTETPQPTPTPVGLLPEGPHVLNDGEPFDGVPTLRTTVTIPAPDWYGEAGDGILIKNDNSAAPDGAGMITFFGDLYVYGDPCEWATTRPDEPATTVDELVSALAAQASRDASEPVDVTVGGYAGKGITLHVPDDAVMDRATLRRPARPRRYASVTSIRMRLLMRPSVLDCRSSRQTSALGSVTNALRGRSPRAAGALLPGSAR